MASVKATFTLDEERRDDPNGLIVGALYGVVAMCFVLIYKASRVVNFAQGELLLLGAWVCWALMVKYQAPFYVAMPLSTLDRALHDGVAEIPIEERSAREVTHLSGRGADGAQVEVQLAPDGTPAANPAFDVTPARLVSALITERGVVPATREGVDSLFAEVP